MKIEVTATVKYPFMTKASFALWGKIKIEVKLLLTFGVRLRLRYSFF